MIHIEVGEQPLGVCLTDEVIYGFFRPYCYQCLTHDTAKIDEEGYFAVRVWRTLRHRRPLQHVPLYQTCGQRASQDTQGMRLDQATVLNPGLPKMMVQLTFFHRNESHVGSPQSVKICVILCLVKGAHFDKRFQDLVDPDNGNTILLMGIAVRIPIIDPQDITRLSLELA
jgi:hypothetical protein